MICVSVYSSPHLFTGPVQNLVTNAGVFIDSFNCNNNLSFALMKSRYELMSEPVKQLMKDFKASAHIDASQMSSFMIYCFQENGKFPLNIILQKESGRLNKRSEKASRQFTVVENEVDDEDEIADLEEANAKVSLRPFSFFLFLAKYSV